MTDSAMSTPDADEPGVGAPTSEARGKPDGGSVPYADYARLEAENLKVGRQVRDQAASFLTLANSLEDENEKLRRELKSTQLLAAVRGIRRKRQVDRTILVSVALDAYHAACHAGENNLQAMERAVDAMLGHIAGREKR